jgi:hypothetical protein
VGFDWDRSFEASQDLLVQAPSFGTSRTDEALMKLLRHAEEEPVDPVSP